MSKNLREVREWNHEDIQRKSISGRKKQQVKKNLNQWFPHATATEASKTKTSPIPIFQNETWLQYDRVQYSNMSLKKKRYSYSPYCISVWTGKKKNNSPPGECFPIPRRTAWGLECGLISKLIHRLSQVSLYRAQLAWHYTNRETPAPWNN